MAILNFAKTYAEISPYLNIEENNSGDFVKLFFSKDGHIISHGIDYTKDYLNGSRGLVPNTTATGKQVLTDTGWANITTSLLPLASTIAQGTTTNLLSAKQVIDYVSQQISNGFASNDAMLFKGVIDSQDDLPSQYQAGWTYKIATAGVYAGKQCEIGDMLIATQDSSSTQIDLDPDHWQAVQTNINGYSIIKINDKTYQVYTNNNISEYQLYAPTTLGDSGQILTTDGDTLTWISSSNISAGSLGSYTSSTLVQEITANNGVISIKVGDSTKNVTASGSWDITSAKVANNLTIGTGLAGVSENNPITIYNGSQGVVLNLKQATKTTLGGVIVGNNISVLNGTISLTKDNITDALGYVPSDPSGLISYSIVSRSVDGLAPKIEFQTDQITSSYYLLAIDGSNENKTTPSWHKLSSNLFTNTWRPIKINGEEKLNQNSNSSAFNIINGNNVNLIFSEDGLLISAIDTTYDVVTTTKAGLMSASDKIKLNGISSGAEVNQNAFSNIELPDTTIISASTKTDTVQFVGSNINIIGSDKTITFSVPIMSGASISNDSMIGLVPVATAGNQLKYLRGDGTWATPTNTNTWRPIEINGTSLYNNTTNSNNILKIQQGNNVSITNVDNVLTINSSYVDTTYSNGEGILLNNNIFSLSKATTSTLGGIKVSGLRNATVTLNPNTSIDGRYFGVELDSTGKAFVNIPQRDIRINGNSIGNKILNIKPSDEIYIFKDDSSTEDVYEIGFGLGWYNLTTKQYEFA